MDTEYQKTSPNLLDITKKVDSVLYIQCVGGGAEVYVVSNFFETY